MASPVSLRLGEQTRRRVARIARRKKVCPSVLMRQAIEKMTEQEEQQLSSYELMKDLIGVVNSGDPHNSENIGRKFAKFLKERRSRT